MEKKKRVLTIYLYLYTIANNLLILEGMPSLSDLLGQAQVKEPVTEEISRLKLIVDEASLNLRDAEKKRDDLKQNVCYSNITKYHNTNYYYYYYYYY